MLTILTELVAAAASPPCTGLAEQVDLPVGVAVTARGVTFTYGGTSLDHFDDGRFDAWSVVTFEVSGVTERWLPSNLAEAQTQWGGVCIRRLAVSDTSMTVEVRAEAEARPAIDADALKRVLRGQLEAPKRMPSLEGVAVYNGMACFGMPDGVLLCARDVLDRVDLKDCAWTEATPSVFQCETTWCGHCQRLGLRTMLTPVGGSWKAAAESFEAPPHGCGFCE